MNNALAPRALRVPRPPLPAGGMGRSGRRCQLASCILARRFKSRQLNQFLAVVFESLPSAVRMAGLPPVTLSQWDLFHAHLFYSPAVGQLGLLFHAQEYPAHDIECFPIDLGFCQRASPLAYSQRAMEVRNLLFVGGTLCALDMAQEAMQPLLADGLGAPVFTVQEEDLGLPLAELNYLAFAANRKPAERLFVCATQ